MSEVRETVEARFSVPSSLSDRRLDQVAAALMPEHSRSRIQDWIRQGALTVNGKVRKPRDKVLVDDDLQLRAEVTAEITWEAEAIDLNILYEDEHLIVLDKPAGLVVHPAAGNPDGTLVNALLHHAPELDHLPRAGIVHRLDKDTSGVMVVARSLVAHTSLVDQLQTRTMGREYDAVVVGTLTGGGTVDEPIGRHPRSRKKMAVVRDGKPAVTHYRREQLFSAHTHIRCRLETGRTHQIRVHMAHIHHPLVGDPAYGGRPRFPKGADDTIKGILEGFRRQALHARVLELVHPTLEETMVFEAALPEDMQRLLQGLADFEARGRD